MNLPNTIKNPYGFMRSPAAQSDGVMHYDWINRAFNDPEYGDVTRITAMDLDALLERCGHFCVFESKDEGVEIPKGQEITLQRLWLRGDHTIFIVVGKSSPKLLKMYWERNSHAPFERHKIESGLEATHHVVRWRMYAESHPDSDLLKIVPPPINVL